MTHAPAIEAPDWFRSALTAPVERLTVPVEGVAIDALAWGPCDAPGLVFVHGMYAHAGWWSFIAPAFAHNHRCVAFTLSGMGQSGWREQYSTATYCREIDVVASACGIVGPRVIVAHSFGGIVARRYAEALPPNLAGLILIDSPTTRNGEPGRRSSMPASARYRPFASAQEAVRHFRLVPPQLCADPFIVDHVARGALRQDPDGWRWSMDPDLRGHMAPEGYHRRIGPISAKAAFIWGEQSPSLSAEDRTYAREALPDAQAITIPDSGHHVMLDQPLQLIDRIGAVLDGWSRLGPN